MEKGKVYLAGGGCGDAGLVTLKTWRILQGCDAVVYDSLAPEELLRWTRPDCERIYVGKRCRRHSRKQDEINALLVQKAREGKTVVRLKGGDPYVFGRGGEEFQALLDAGIRCEVIPGITSAIAAPAAAGIPVTHRGLSDSVTVVTGTTADMDGHGRPELDFGTLARLAGTLVILMGMHHLEEIVAGLLEAGKDRHTPCAIIMEGTTDRQRTLRAPLFALPDRAAEQGFSSPAVIVVGAVAKLSLLMEQTAAGANAAFRERQGAEDVRQDGFSLAGVSVGVTGTARFAQRASCALREKGADIRDMSFMEIRPVKAPLPDLTGSGWLVFTSPNGVQVFLEKMRQERRDLRSLSCRKIAVIGPGTAETLEEAGLYADYMPEVYDAIHLARGLADLARGPCPSVFLRARQGSGDLARVFREQGLPFTEHALYELGIREEKRDAVITKEPDYIVFGSAMGARAYFEGLRARGLQNGKSRYVCIGERCAQEVRKYAPKPPLVAENPCVDAITACLCRNRKRKDGQPCTDSED